MSCRDVYDLFFLYIVRVLILLFVKKIGFRDRLMHRQNRKIWRDMVVSSEKRVSHIFVWQELLYSASGQTGRVFVSDLANMEYV